MNRKWSECKFKVSTNLTKQISRKHFNKTLSSEITLILFT